MNAIVELRRLIEVAAEPIGYRRHPPTLADAKTVVTLPKIEQDRKPHQQLEVVDVAVVAAELVAEPKPKQANNFVEFVIELKNHVTELQQNLQHKNNIPLLATPVARRPKIREILLEPVQAQLFQMVLLPVCQSDQRSLR